MKRQIVLWTAGIVLFGAALFAIGRLTVRGAVPQGPPAYSLSPGATGMISGGTGYFYDFSATDTAPIEDLVAEVQRYLDRQGNPDLAVARLREFTTVYQAEVIERSTGRHAFGLMLGKGTLQISPKAGPNLFWNTKYGSLIAEVGGGYGMLGRLLPQAPANEMALSESEARSIAEKAVQEVDPGLKLDDEVATFYGFYEFHVSWEGELVGEMDINGYNGQVWYKEWGGPQIGVQNLISEQ